MQRWSWLDLLGVNSAGKMLLLLVFVCMCFYIPIPALVGAEVLHCCLYWNFLEGNLVL